MDDADLFLGSWRLVSFEARTPSGVVIEPFGPDADGVITYSAGRRMSAVVWAPDRKPFAVADQTQGSAAENAAALATIVQYLGTYDVDPAAKVVVHHLEQSVFPNWNGVDQLRYYAFAEDGDRLELSAPPITFNGEPLVAALTWRRLTAG